MSKEVFRYLRYVSDIRVLYLLGGVTVSVIAHELVHLLMHLDTVESIHFFPDALTIVSIPVAEHMSAAELMNEEAVAYFVSTIVLFITVMDIFAIHDSRDQRSVDEIVRIEHVAHTESI